MLSKMIVRGAQQLIKKQGANMVMGVQQFRGFREDFQNPYKHNPVPITEQERKAQEALPVWERVFDYKKYMEHDGPLKVNI